eukprot:TRINITY_DN35301_c0_g1_i1.p1 TRINITY_DN35301_c0_g1~~TRINITY_DN35301_c0_g1_i1.p1  ORF type:complete len:318 (-),score=39.96 TRINITY_DN35301_c0_g1_i1:318-1205(-)
MAFVARLHRSSNRLCRRSLALSTLRPLPSLQQVLAQAPLNSSTGLAAPLQKVRWNSSSSSSQKPDENQKSEEAEASSEKVKEEKTDAGSKPNDQSDNETKKTTETKTPQETKLVVKPPDLLDVATMPLRHIAHLTTLGFVTMMVPLEWNWSEFSEGSELAVAAVYDLLGKKDVSDLRNLVTNPLFQEIQQAYQGEGLHSFDDEGWSAPPKLIETVTMSVFSSSAHPGQSEQERSAIRVTPLMKVLEEYHFEGEERPVRIRRLLKWQFERRVGGDGPDAWQISGLGDQWFHPRKIQ